MNVRQPHERGPEIPALLRIRNGEIMGRRHGRHSGVVNIFPALKGEDFQTD